MKGEPKKLLNPKDARLAGVDQDGSLWVDGNAKGIRSAVVSDEFRRGWEAIWGKRKCGSRKARA